MKITKIPGNMKQSRVACESCLHVLQTKFGDNGQSGGPLKVKKTIEEVTEIKRIYLKFVEKADAEHFDKCESFIATGHKIQECLVLIEKQALTFADRNMVNQKLNAKSTQEKIELQLNSLQHYKQ